LIQKRKIELLAPAKDIETADNIIKNHGYTAFYRAQVMVRKNRVIKTT